MNKKSKNFFAEGGQAAFNPANVVPRIGFSPDKKPAWISFNLCPADRR